MITVLNLISVSIAAVQLTAAPAPRLPFQPAATDVWVERQIYAMGTMLRARVAAPDRAAGARALEAVFERVAELERSLSSWTADSEIGRVNGSRPGERVVVSPALSRLLGEVVQLAEETGGAFSPAVGALVDVWDQRGAGRKPDAKALARALEATGLRHFSFDGEAGAVTRARADSWLDTGGFGKGAALREAERVLREMGITAAYLDFGGQLLVFGEPAGGGLWEASVAHPGLRQEATTRLALGDGSIATSGQSERYVEVDGERFGHVLDPRSGCPVDAWGSVTVVAADAMVADVLSTALLVMGPEAGMRWAAGREEVGVLFLVQMGDGVVETWNAAFERYRN